MGTEVVWSSSAEEVLDRAGAFLATDPVRHNLILTLLTSRAASEEPGRYWRAVTDGAVVGVVFQSPLEFVATATPMAPEVVAAIVDSIVAGEVRLPGVSGDAATAARFAGCWTEAVRGAAHVEEAQRIYEVTELRPPSGVAGAGRIATADDVELVAPWFAAFETEVRPTARPANLDPTDPKKTESVVQGRVARAELWVWEDGDPVTVVGVSRAVAGVARVGPVYTPGEHRRHGYASALTAVASQDTLDRGARCILYTQLDNPTSNAIYRDIGYRAAAETLVYHFS